MADPDINYIKNSELVLYYGGNTVPGDDSIEENLNLAVKNLIDREINGILRVTSNATDTYGDYNRIAHKMYQRWLDDGTIQMAKEDRRFLCTTCRSPAIA
jgi:hypothetical protein